MMRPPPTYLCLYCSLALLIHKGNAFTSQIIKQDFKNGIDRTGLLRLNLAKGPQYPIPENEEELLSQLRTYLEIREQALASEETKTSSKKKKKKAGGSRGNFLLEYTSTAPQVIELLGDDEKGILDYDELTKYGFQHLVKPIMKSGGRPAMYGKLGLVPPPTPERLRPKSARKLEIDREGDSNPKRYTGLKMTTIVDDDEMGRALEAVSKKKKEEDAVKAPEEEYMIPFSDLPKSRYKMTPDYTPEMIDKEAESRGRAISWAREQRLLKESKRDDTENFEIAGSLRVYSSITFLITALAFGKSTPIALASIGITDFGAIQAPALALDAASVGSALVSFFVLAPEKNRNPVTWGLKGLIGGPAAILQLRELEAKKPDDGDDE